MITDIRTYFNVQVLAIDPVLLAWDEDLFGNNDDSVTQSEKYYNLSIGTLTPLRDSNSHTDSVPVTLDIWSTVSNDKLVDFDALYDKAIDIKNCIITPLNIYDITYNFTDIELVSIEPIEQDTSDNTFKIRLSFIVRNSFKF